MDKKNIVMVALGFSLFFVFTIFLFGDLGIVQTHRKEIRLNKLQKEIAIMKKLDNSKKKLIKKLRDDAATLKKQATLYGLVGGIAVVEKSLEEPMKVVAPAVNQDRQNNYSSIILLEHPALLILLVIIVLLITGLILNIKSKQLIKLPQKKAYIKPTWN